MAQKKQSGLGRGIAAIIPSSAAKGPSPSLGKDAADAIFGAPAIAQRRPGGAPNPALGVRGDKAHQPGAQPADHEHADAQQDAAAPGRSAGRRGAAPAASAADFGATYQEIPIGEISPNPRQPRTVFEEEGLAELIHSIREFGLLQPVVVRPVADGSFELIMGERRWRAAAKAGLSTIPAIVRLTKDENLLRDALLENIHRVQLNPLEEAAAYQQLLEDFGVTQQELAERLGRSRPQVTNTLRLLKLPVPVQRRVAAGVLSAGHARALLSLEDDTAGMSHIAERIVAEGLSVRATEEAVTLWKREGMVQRAPVQRPEQPAFFQSSASRLSDRFDTKVTVTMGKRKGKMVVEFGDMDDFERILALIEGEDPSA